ncbi:hypothetical protein B0I72DRAFT_140310 [Yarrowia lipolytica]|uniref:Secreted protein n=1 Tax=Yarrowia lipolytica TaxID=4952 RepID=A0A371C1X4_YARLL|nr:hypothetical protein BKA91DRAFT_137494 [Yarrowia lipolytica]KAE8170008.1 hypothetical protein BKA90DRAFT_141623 [Yarrowia lipolytica]RDW24294.1 hypothetical protein B0I71DRAFT_134536 [Yarrowia lipolytica]RDW31171.1 hypothetical protein B0I72DRAFT_140310 [Yarrowia lipolytica]RDW41409.1 hypothetical protein B0I73DRAFT_128773 [Yarrowia lipolytica]
MCKCCCDCSLVSAVLCSWSCSCLCSCSCSCSCSQSVFTAPSAPPSLTHSNCSHQLRETQDTVSPVHLRYVSKAVT